MSGRRTTGSGRRGWDQPSRTPTWAYGLIALLLGLIAALILAIVLLMGNGTGGLANATSTPTLGPSEAASIQPSEVAQASPTPAITPEVTAPPATSAPTSAPTAAPTGAPTALPSGSPAGTGAPTLVTATIPHKADCNGENGTGQIGMISISWTATGVTGVRISIDPPTAATAYGYGYADYGPTGPAIVPFACGLTLHDSGGYYHFYVITTLHTTGYYQYRYQKVYQSPAPTP
ncbi:MAG TPA: hypothetical protein VKR30_10110 [Candidatus Limnocylindrales bacterium]|nr:hypothetical protein [Candidatus Limnocylindrales bacterium]